MKWNKVKTLTPLFFILLHFIFFLLWSGCGPSPKSSAEISPELALDGEAISLLGDTLRRLEDDENTFQQKDSLLREAYLMYLEDSTDLDNIIWYGRRLAYLYRYKEAIAVFTRGIHYHPRSPELYRHRGHRYITLRRLEDAIEDLERGANLARKREKETEPDGIPNKLNIPLSNLHFNLYYHLGLAYFLLSDYQKAIDAYLACMEYSDNPDLQVATTDWLYLSYLRSGDKFSADQWLKDIHPDMEIIENDGYLERLLIYKGQKEPIALTDPEADQVAFATQNYGISCWLDLNGRHTEASTVRRLILTSGFWPAFGYIAAEADSSRMRVH